MKNLKYILSVLAGTLVYVLICITCGRNGIWASNQLLEQKRLISANTQNIQNINEQLILEKTAIQNDEDVIAAYARKLGYVKEGEKIVKVKGLAPVQTMMYDTGSVLKSREVLYVSESVCKAAGITAGLIVFVLMLLYDISYGHFSFKKKEFETVAGIPVYDVPQV